MATDLTNKIFGHLTVLNLDKAKSQKMNSRSYWICQCDCENKTIKSIRADHLTCGDTISCGCEQKKKSGRKEIDITGQIFGRLTVVEKIDKINKSGHVYWKCQCECGNFVEASGVNLRSGNIQSCGCLKSEISSKIYKELGEKRISKIEGQVFGKLTVLKDSGERSSSKEVLWLCQCECGKITKVQTGNLTSGHTSSCGCIGKSKNERNIDYLLKKNNINYQTQYNICNKLRADFYIENKYIVEFDGIQHFKYFNNNGWNNKENFEKTRERDLIKNKYCFDNNIPLIRIPYDADYTINDLKLETTRFLLTPENETEYYESRA